MYERYIMVINFYIYIIKHKFYKILRIFTKFHSQLFLKLCIFIICEHILCQEFLVVKKHFIFDQILYVIKKEGYLYCNNWICSIKV